MRITHLSTTDQAGGAARAARRLHQGLLEIGCESRMLVQRKFSSDPTVIPFVPPADLTTRLRRSFRRRHLSLDRRALEELPKGASFFSEDRSEHGADVLRQLPGQDILHLHWVSGFFDCQQFFGQVSPTLPMVWTLHDMNPFTGGCHFDGGCGKFATACSACPQLGSRILKDLSSRSWHRKLSTFESIATDRLHLVAPCLWMANEARKSSILGKYPVSIIPYGLDTELFKPSDKQYARGVLGIPADANVVLFVADCLDEKRKGLHKLLMALAEPADICKPYLVTLGRDGEFTTANIAIQNLGFVQEDERVALAYSAADVFVAPSLQDNFPNTVLEALACGVPVVAFAIGGSAEALKDGETGVLVTPNDHEHLRVSIQKLLRNPDLRAKMSRSCRQTAEEMYSLRVQAAQYKQVYESLLRLRVSNSQEEGIVSHVG